MAAGNFVLADYVKTVAYLRGVDEATVKRSTLVRTGVVVEDAGLTAAIGSTSGRITMPAWEMLEDYGTEMTTSDLSQLGAAQHTSQVSQENLVIERATTFGFADLSIRRSPLDPRARINEQQGEHWALQNQKLILSMLTGIFANNNKTVANGGGAGDMISDHSVSGSATSASRFSLKNFISARSTRDQNMDRVGVVFVGPGQYADILELQNSNLIGDSDLAPNVITFTGFPVVLDADLPSGTSSIIKTGTGTSNANNETAFILSPGVFRHGTGVVEIPAEVERAPRGGKGAGGSYLVVRRADVFHPEGFTVANAALTGAGESGIGIGTSSGQWGHADTFSRIYDRENVAITAMTTTQD